MSTTIIPEPHVTVTNMAADTGDTGLSRMDGLMTSAPLITDYGPEGITLISDQKELLTKFTDPNSPDHGKLTARLHSTFHHIYSILPYTRVLVVKVSTSSIKPGGNEIGGSNLASVFGTGLFIKYQGKVGLTNSGQSVYLDADNNIMDTKLVHEVPGLSIESSEFLNLVTELSALGVQVYGYKYDSTDVLSIQLLYNNEEVNAVELKELLGYDTPDNPNVPQLNPYQFIVVGWNEIGNTIDNTFTFPLELKITDKSGLTASGSITINGRLRPIEISQSGSSAPILVEVTPNDVTVLLSEDFESVDELDILSTIKFVDTMKSELSPEYGESTELDITHVIASMNSLLDLDLGYRIDFLWDSGICDAGLSGALDGIAKKLLALNLFSVSEKIGSVQDIYQFKAESNTGSEFTYALSPYSKVNLGGYFVDLSPQVEYIKAISRNKSNLKEFAPVFGIVNGIVDVNPNTYFSKSAREELLGCKVNTIKRDRFRGISYINDNYTGISGNSLFNEEQIIRMANRIGWDLGYLMDQFLGELDIEDTASRMKNVISIYFSNNIMNQQYAPAKFDVIIDSTNNEFGDGEMNVEVNIYVGRALKKINVLNKFLPLSAMN